MHMLQRPVDITALSGNVTIYHMQPLKSQVRADKQL
jgi:hypothetical protein